MNQDLIQKKVFTRLAEKGIAGLIIHGYDNITYLTQIPLPFAQSLPHKRSALILTAEKAFVICPPEYAQVLKENGFGGVLVTEAVSSSPAAHAAKIVSLVKEQFADVACWGFDGSRVSQSVWQALNEALPLSDCEADLSELRMVKEGFEIEALTQASRMAELGIVSTLNHTEGTFDAVSYSRAESAERMRVHVAEFGGQAAGQVSALQGDDLRRFHGVNHGMISSNGFTRYDLTAAYGGYWAAGGRTIFVGIPEKKHEQAYADNLKLKRFAVSLLKPGIKCSELFAQVQAQSEALGIPFMAAAGIGYGVGVSEREAPFLNGSDETVLAENMVLAVDLWTYGPEGEWIHSIDTYAITADGAERISWYRDYDRKLYRMIGVTARHG